MAVYTEVGDDDLARFLTQYDLGTLLSYKGIAEGVENTNYLVHTTSGTLILTLYEKRVDLRDLPFFLGLMEHLAGKGISCPLPVRDRNGDKLNTLAGRHAALISFIEGVWPRRISAQHCHEVGAAMARLHLAAEGFDLRRDNTLGLAGWRTLFNRFAHDADTIAPGLRATITATLEELDARWPRDLPAGIIHADLFPDNVFFIGDRLSGIIDFYFACRDALAYDIAVALNAWCFSPSSEFEIEKARALFAGYESVRPLTGAEADAFPDLARGAAMRFLLTRGFDWLNTPKTALVARKDPLDYLRRLAFHNAAASIAVYGRTGRA